MSHTVLHLDFFIYDSLWLPLTHSDSSWLICILALYVYKTQGQPEALLSLTSFFNQGFLPTETPRPLCLTSTTELDHASLVCINLRPREQWPSSPVMLDIRCPLAPQHNIRSNCTNQADFFKSRQTSWHLAHLEKNRAKTGPLKLLYLLTINTILETNKSSSNS